MKNATKISAALRALSKLAIRALRYSVGGFTPDELKRLAADAVEVALELLDLADEAEA